MIKLGVLGSTNGTDLQAILDAIDAGYGIWCDPRIRVGHEKTRVI